MNPDESEIADFEDVRVTFTYYSISLLSLFRQHNTVCPFKNVWPHLPYDLMNSNKAFSWLPRGLKEQILDVVNEDYKILRLFDALLLPDMITSNQLPKKVLNVVNDISKSINLLLKHKGKTMSYDIMFGEVECLIFQKGFLFKITEFQEMKTEILSAHSLLRMVLSSIDRNRFYFDNPKIQLPFLSSRSQGLMFYNPFACPLNKTEFAKRINDLQSLSTTIRKTNVPSFFEMLIDLIDPRCETNIFVYLLSSLKSENVYTERKRELNNLFGQIIYFLCGTHGETAREKLQLRLFFNQYIPTEPLANFIIISTLFNSKCEGYRNAVEPLSELLNMFKLRSRYLGRCNPFYWRNDNITHLEDSRAVALYQVLNSKGKPGKGYALDILNSRQHLVQIIASFRLTSGKKKEALQNILKLVQSISFTARNTFFLGKSSSINLTAKVDTNLTKTAFIIMKFYFDIYVHLPTEIKEMYRETLFDFTELDKYLAEVQFRPFGSSSNIDIINLSKFRETYKDMTGYNILQLFKTENSTYDITKLMLLASSTEDIDGLLVDNTILSKYSDPKLDVSPDLLSPDFNNFECFDIGFQQSESSMQDDNDDGFSLELLAFDKLKQKNIQLGKLANSFLIKKLRDEKYFKIQGENVTQNVRILIDKMLRYFTTLKTKDNPKITEETFEKLKLKDTDTIDSKFLKFVGHIIHHCLMCLVNFKPFDFGIFKDNQYLLDYFIPYIADFFNVCTTECLTWFHSQFFIKFPDMCERVLFKGLNRMGYGMPKVDEFLENEFIMYGQHTKLTPGIQFLNRDLLYEIGDSRLYYIISYTKQFKLQYLEKTEEQTWIDYFKAMRIYPKNSEVVIKLYNTMIGFVQLGISSTDSNLKTSPTFAGVVAMSAPSEFIVKSVESTN